MVEAVGENSPMEVAAAHNFRSPQVPEKPRSQINQSPGLHDSGTIRLRWEQQKEPGEYELPSS